MVLVCIVILLLPGMGTMATEELPKDLYLEQAGSRTCTLCSATMMLRSCFYIMGNDLWQQIAEDAVAVSAWTSDGLYWNWNYEIEENVVKIAQQGCSGISEDKLKQVLDAHPEGIVLYCGGGAPHAVFLTDYADGVFYCADPAKGYAGKRIPLAESLLGNRHGGQAGILSAVSAYWYISSHNIEDRSYLAGCKEYPINYRIRVRWDGDAMSLPCGENTESEKMFRIHSGEYFKANAFLINREGQYWYRIGKNVYVSADDAKRVFIDIQNSNQNDESQGAVDVVPLLINSDIPLENAKKY